jgi:23S rRNA (uracil1939-C5)-methyltransferase
MIELEIESLDLEANGVARPEGKVIFVRGALPGERVQAEVVRRKPRFEVANTLAVLREAAARTRPRCPHYGVCGGCSMQHLDIRSQLATKQRALEDQLAHLGNVRAETILRPIAGPDWGYRYRARLSVRHVVKKGGVLVGFHEKGSSFVADMRECHVLAPRVSALLVPLRELIGGLAMRDRMPQIEVALAGEGAHSVLALVFRVLDAVTEPDRQALVEFARRHQLELWLQPKGPDTIRLLWAPGADQADAPRSQLAYRLPEFDVEMPFAPTDFTQVNHQINEVLVSRSVRLLDPQPSDRVADLFCGLGNFSLPLARRSREVLGIEGSPTLTARAAANAAANGLGEKTRFQAAARAAAASSACRWHCGAGVVGEGKALGHLVVGQRAAHGHAAGGSSSPGAGACTKACTRSPSTGQGLPTIGAFHHARARPSTFSTSTEKIL